MNVTAYSLACRFVGTKEVPGQPSHPLILAMLRLDQDWPEGDEVPWCSAFLNFVAWLLRLPRSKSLLARSWLGVGVPIDLEAACPGYDIVILSRQAGEEEPPGPDNLTAPGHVGFFAGLQGRHVLLLGGNQGNTVNIQAYDKGRILGVRRLYV